MGRRCIFLDYKDIGVNNKNNINSWSLTPIGKIDNVDAEELRTVLGTGDVTVTLSLE